jgi:fructose transport system substrate-binding protein
MLRKTKTALLGAIIAMAGSGAAFADAHGGISACLITKTDTNPFFVKMREGRRGSRRRIGH